MTNVVELVAAPASVLWAARESGQLSDRPLAELVGHDGRRPREAVRSA